MRRSATRSCRCALLKPKIAILDETDSGLDVDALRVVSEGVNRATAESPVGVLLITHYTRILRYIKPDFVHVFVAGRIVEEGGPELAEKLENEGYAAYVKDSNEQARLEASRGMTQTVSRPAGAQQRRSRWTSRRSGRTSRS